MRTLVCSALALLAACGSTPNRPVRGAAPALSPDPVAEAPAGASGDAEAAEAPAVDAGPVGRLVARIGGQPVTVQELFGAWLHRESRQVRAYVDELVLSRLVLLEAARLGVVVPQSAMDEAFGEATERLREEVARAGGGMGLEDFLARRLGLDGRRYMATVREQTAIDLAAARVVRAWLLTSERAEVRVILTDAREKAVAARAALEAGDLFEDVRAAYSSDLEGDGRVPPVVKGDTAMSHLAFTTPVGGVGGPVEEGGRWLLMWVDGRPAPAAGPWDELGPLVEASLAERDIEDPEYWQWKNWVSGQYEVDLSPLLELSGGALLD